MKYHKQLTADTQNETRENTMFGNNKTISSTDIPEKPPVLSGIQAGGWLAAFLLPLVLLLAPSATLAQDACDDAVYPAFMTCTPDGSGVVLDNDNTSVNVGGVIDLSAVSGGYIFNNNTGAFWDTGNGVNTLGTGVLNNAGTIRPTGASNIGAIGDTDTITVISAPGSTFTGTGDSTLDMTMFLDGTGQTGCANVTVAGCLDLRGGATAGQTSILVRGRFTTLVTGPLTAVTSANPGIVLVDVGGGASEAGHFVLHPDSVLREVSVPGDPVATAAYAADPVYGAVLDTSVIDPGSIFDYALLYNPNTQQHLLASVPQREATEYVSLIHETVSIWHTTGDAVAGRQADLRDGATGKFWFRFSADRTERDSTPTFTSHGNTFTYDRSYKLDTKAAIFGFDLISEDNRVLGVHGGLVDARLTHESSDGRDETEGVTFGGYAGWWNETGLSLDGTLNVNVLGIDHELGSGFEQSDVDIASLGLRAEAGWRLPLMEERLYVQPLATAAYVNANIEDIDLQDNSLSYEDTQSLRFALGARLGGETALDSERFDRLGYWLTARAWDEQVDDGEVQFATRDGGHLAIKDDRSGSLEEVAFGVNLSNQENEVSVYLAGGATSGDNEDGFNVSFGLRKNW